MRARVLTFLFLALPLLSLRLPAGEDDWVVQLHPALATAPSSALAAAGLDLVRPVAGLPGHYVVRPRAAAGVAALRSADISTLGPVARSALLRRPRQDKSEAEPAPLLWSEPDRVAPLATRAIPTDGLLANQWHLFNTGAQVEISGQDANLFLAWNRGYTGAGFVIGVLDEWVESNHPDLSANYRADLSRQFITTTILSDEDHGTSVAGVAAARDNGVGTVGAAFRASLAGLRILDSIENSSISASQIAEALLHRNDAIAIYNNSWGYVVDQNNQAAGYLNVTRSAVILQALRTGAENGRGGRGSLTVWAAGNSRELGDNVNYDAMASSIYTIAVGASGDRGTFATYSQPGASMFICAPSSGNVRGITTTDRTGSAGASTTDYRDDFGGTSSASPLVSGILALMLEANPNLTWRDVQYILARTAVKTDPTHPDWIVNGAGYHLNHNYGFGRIDAGAATGLAASWPGLPEASEFSQFFAGSSQTIPDNNPTGLTRTATVTQNLQLEHVLVNVESNHPDWGDLEIVLTSPSGTSSVLASPFASAENPENNSWQFMTVRHWGENAQGTWTLSVSDRSSGQTGALTGASLVLRGIPPQANRRPTPQNDLRDTTTGSVTLGPLANDTDPDGDALTLLSVVRPPRGGADLLGTIQVTVSHPSHLRLTSETPYLVTDGQGNTAFGTIHVRDIRPDAVDDSVATVPGVPVFVFPLLNDLDADADPLSLTAAGPTTDGGSFQLLQNHYLRYVPAPGFTGQDSLPYSLADGSDGEDTAQVTVLVPATSDLALRFNRPDAAAEIPASPALAIPGPFTVEAWIRPEGYGEAPTGFGRIVDKEAFLLYLNGTGHDIYPDRSLLLYIRQNAGTAAALYSPANTIQLNTWYHVAATYNGAASAQLFVNGQPVPTTLATGAGFDPLTGPLQDNASEPFVIGENADRTRAFSGRIDEVRLWNRALAPAEIASRWNAILAGSENGLLGYWPVFEGSGTVLRDLGPFGFDGLLDDTSWESGQLPGHMRHLWDHALDLGDGWKLQDWFGLFNDSQAPWTYHRTLGWVFLLANQESSIFLYDPVIGEWLWTSSAAFPWLYRYSSSHWLLYYTNSSAPRRFYDTASGLILEF